MNNNRHIIQKQIFNLVLQGKEDSFEIQQQVSHLCKEKLNPKLDDIFSRLAKTDEVIQIDRLDINIGSILAKDLEKQLVEKVTQAIEEKITSLIKKDSPEVEIRPTNINNFEAYLLYLKKGVLAWQTQDIEEKKIQQSFLETLAFDTSALGKFRHLIQQNSTALERLVKQSDEKFIQNLLKACLGTNQSSLTNFKQQLEKEFTKIPTQSLHVIFGRKEITKREFHLLFWQQIIKFALSAKQMPSQKQVFSLVLENLNSRKTVSPALSAIKIQIKQAKNSVAIFQQVISKINLEIEEDLINTNKTESSSTETPASSKSKEQKMSRKADKTKEKSNPSESAKEKKQFTQKINEQEQVPSNQPTDAEEIDSTTSEKAPTGTAYYIQNAGLVLLHPFLPTLFKACHLWAENKFTSESAQQKAVHLLHYLSSGETEAPEYNLLLSKFLCGMKFSHPIDRKVKLSTKEIKESEHLLQVVIDQWGSMGKVKADSLREAFLQREGKLEKRESGWHLLVEQKTIDILLGQLPWGIGMIKLPWMGEILMVEWA